MEAFETGALVTAIDATVAPGAVGAAGLAALCPHAACIAPTTTIVAVVSAITKPRPLRFHPRTSAMSVRSSNDRTQQVTSAAVPNETAGKWRLEELRARRSATMAGRPDPMRTAILRESAISDNCRTTSDAMVSTATG